MNNYYRQPGIVILDLDKDRCLREEAALVEAIKKKDISGLGVSNYGMGYISRSGVPKEKLPCIEIGELYFYPPRIGEELTYDILCRFLDMLLKKKLLRQCTDNEIEAY